MKFFNLAMITVIAVTIVIVNRINYHYDLYFNHNGNTVYICNGYHKKPSPVTLVYTENDNLSFVKATTQEFVCVNSDKGNIFLSAGNFTYTKTGTNFTIGSWTMQIHS